MMDLFRLSRWLNWAQWAEHPWGPGRTEVKLQLASTLTTPLSTSTQKTILEPFKSLHSMRQKVILNGEINQNYKEDFIAIMVPPVQWVRGLAFERYDFVLAMKNEGDLAIAAGNWIRAKNSFVAARLSSRDLGLVSLGLAKSRTLHSKTARIRFGLLSCSA